MAITAIRPGVVTFSVDLTGCEPQDAYRSHTKPAPVGELAKLFLAWEVPATWVVDCLKRLGDEDRLARLDLRQEIAMVGDREWAAVGASRRRFAAELSRRLLRARACGCSTTTLFLRGATEIAHTDLALKYGLTVICPVGAVRSSSRPTEPARPRLFRPRDPAPKGQKLRAVRFGLWQIAPLACWPSNGRTLLWTGGVGRLRRAIDYAESHLTVAHIMIDGAALISAKRGGRRALEKVLRYVDSRCQAGRLQIDSLAGLAAHLRSTRRSAPSRSILRRAA